MKKLIFFISFSMSCLFCNSQDKAVQPVKEPDFFYQPAFLDSNNVQHDLTYDKVKTLTYEQVFKTILYLIIDSVNANFRIPENKQIRMIVKYNPVAVTGSIQNYFRLYRLTINEKERNRRFMVSSHKSFVKSITNYNRGLPVNFTKITASTYLLTFENLARGEYAIIVSSNTNSTIYSFSVI